MKRCSSCRRNRANRVRNNNARRLHPPDLDLCRLGVLQDADRALLDRVAVGIKRPVVVVEFNRAAGCIRCAVRLARREVADILDDLELAPVASLVKLAPDAKESPAKRFARLEAQRTAGWDRVSIEGRKHCSIGSASAHERSERGGESIVGSH